MQKIIQRTARAERVVARQKAKKREHKKAGQSWERNQGRLRNLRELNQRIRDDRTNRTIDWECGQLAPRRDVGEQEKTYGAMHYANFALPDIDPEHRPRWVHIDIGDRVVMTRGTDKGRIAIVQDIDLDKAAVQVKDLNLVNVNIPDWIKLESDDGRQDVHMQAQFVPLSDVKLVYPLPHPETGAPRDVIIDRMIRVNSVYDKNKREWDQGDRVIPGTNTIIPWPEKADPMHEDHEDDTLRITVEEQTFRPFLIRPPMPLSVIDELRNKYSRFRTRHDYDYRVKKELEDAKDEGRKSLINTMRTPLQELAALRAEQKAVQQKELSNEQLAKIGEVIVHERARYANSSAAI